MLRRPVAKVNVRLENRNAVGYFVRGDATLSEERHVRLPRRAPALTAG